MCGISACIRQKGVIDKAKFELMTDIIAHRGPDDRGTFYDEKVALGHRRLAIIDTSSDGHQPFEKVSGYVLVYNGEIYNYIELRDELISRGHAFQTRTDTEVVVIAYKEWGEKCVEHFNGMWSFVLYDQEQQKLFCSRDRFGVKPFYYTESEGMFLIASEIKQFFEILDNNPRANRELLMQYIIRGNIERPPYTLFKDIYQLKPGYNLIYELGSHKYTIKKYYEVHKNKSFKESYIDACNIFRDVFEDSVRLRLRSDVPLGYFLSGGLDSSAIVCVADRLVTRDVARDDFKEQHTVSSCFEEKEYDEQEYIDEVLKNTNVTSHKIFPDEKTMIEELDRLIWHMDEPIGGTTGFAQWSVCKAAKENGLTVMLDGQGSDEQLAGYTDFYTVLFLYALRKLDFSFFKKEVEEYIRLRVPTEKSNYKLVVLSAIKSFLTPVFMEKGLKRLYLMKIAKLPFSQSVIKNVLKNELLYPKRNPEAFIKTYMENELLYQMHQGDRYSMAFSIESRNPFLDYRLVDTVYDMPFEYKLRNGYTKAVLRDGLSGILPEKVQKRISKFGFETPGEKWFAENRDFYHRELEKALQEFRDLFDTDRVLRWIKSDDTDLRLKNGLMWRIIDSARWVKIFNVSV